MKTVKCYNPNGCSFKMLYPEHKQPPAACPLCGYSKSKEDTKRITDQLAYNKKKDEGFTFKDIGKWIAAGF